MSNLFFRAASLAATLLLAQSAYATPRSWSFSSDEDGSARLIYGVPDSPEDVGIVFSCDEPNGKVRVFVAETDEKFKPRQRASASLSAGKAETKIAGKFLPNEDAGIASFEGALSAGDPIFRSLSEKTGLVLRIGAWKQSFDALGEAEKSDKFVAACRKKK